MSAEYEKCQSIGGGAHHWRLTDEGIVERSPGGSQSVMRWQDIRFIRLAYAPTRFKTWRHVLELKSVSGMRFEIDNAHYRGFADFENRSAAYRPFVRELLTRIAARNPQMPVHLGAGISSYVTQLLVLLVSYSLLGIILVVLPVSLGFWPATAIVKLVIIAWMSIYAFRWAVRSRPRQTTASAVPDPALA